MTRNNQYKSVCDRCGAGINNVCVYKGKHYGTTCVQLVSGISFSLLSYVRNNQGQDLDLDEYAKQLEQKEREEKQLEKQKEIVKQENAWIRDVLYKEHYNWRSERLAEKFNYDTEKGERKGALEWDSQFIKDMFEGLGIRRFRDLTEKQKDILIDIYAKSFGRRNSKKYDKAYNFAFDKAYVE